MTTVKEGFERDIAEVCWRELRIHMRRDALVTVAPALDLVAVATAVAVDDTTRVGVWIESGQLGKPTAAQLERWEEVLEKPFKMLIVQPYILMQEV